MSKLRFIALGSVATCVVAGLVLTNPEARHAARRLLPRKAPVHFSSTVATPVKAVQTPMPALSSTAVDPRFAAHDLAGEAGALTPPQLDATSFEAPSATPRAIASATAPAVMERTVQPNGFTPPGDTTFAIDLAGAREAMRHYRSGDRAGGDDFARLTTGTLHTALEWASIRLDSRDAGAPRLQAFVDQHPDWPLLPWVKRRLEEARIGGRDPAVIRALFASTPPQTLGGKLALARVRLAGGDQAGAASVIQGIWREDDLTPAEEQIVLRDFGSVLRREDHKARADRLLYKESVQPALRAAALAGPDVVQLARARAAVIAGTASDAAIAAVPKALQSDVGLLFSRIQKARRANKIAEAAALMQTAPRDPATLIDGDAWWVERRLLARKLLDMGNPKLAFAVAAEGGGESPTSKIEGEFHAGWIALRFLNDPALAAPHFAMVSKLAEAPISVARGAYWQGRAAEAAGQADAAREFYTTASAFSTTFYGQLAAAKLGQGTIVLRQAATPATGDARSEAIRCVEVLFGLGERDLALSLALATAKTEPDPAQVAALAEVVEATRDARATLVVAKAGAQRGMALDEAAFPTFGIPGYQPIDHSADRATVLAIARQESEFDARVVSSAGAMGLMQMIASTARKTAEDAGLPFDASRLLTDASFNARLGAAHLGRLLSDLDGSYILTFAAYNAGGGKVRDWIAAYGDPRKPGVDPVDWIERIPFTETRNYVQRVFENMQIYRAQLGMPTALLTGDQPARGKGT